jgi:sulfur carrier protein ThiS
MTSDGGERILHVTVQAHALLRLGVDSPDGRLEMAVPEGTTVEALIETLGERSSFFHPLSCMALIEGDVVSLDRILCEGEELHLYAVFGGG